MPVLKELPKEIETYIFTPTGTKRPAASKKLKFLCRALNWMWFGQSNFILNLLRDELDVPQSTSFFKGFNCLSGQVVCGNNVGLCNTFFVDYAPVYIADKVGFSFNNLVITSSHDLQDFTKIIAKSIIIERNVWITSNVTILPGVRIGENSVIGAGSIVTTDIPSNVFAAGNPCRIIKDIKRT